MDRGGAAGARSGGRRRVERRARAAASLEAVGLRAADGRKYPHEFSGGQRQRIAIARALITRPKLVVADEPVSALDVSVQAQALNLMSDLQRDAGVTFVLISHDLGVVAHICETTAVMFRGRIVEIGPTDALFAAPAHPYTRELVDATPRLDRPAHVPTGASADPGEESSAGCPYAARCAFARSALPGGGAAAAACRRGDAPRGLSLPAGLIGARRGDRRSTRGATGTPLRRSPRSSAR